MAKTIFTATDAAGTVHKRTSENRTYTHTVVALPSYEFDMAQNDKDWEVDAKNFGYYVQIATGHDPHPTRNYRADYPEKWTAEEIAAGQAHADAENAKRIQDAADRVTGHTRETYVAAQRAERAAKVNARKAKGYYGEWVNLGWCGRPDLAQKLAGQAQGGRYASIAILLTTIVAK